MESAAKERRIPPKQKLKRVAYYLLGVFVLYLWYQAVINILYTGTLFDFSGVANTLIEFLFGYTPLLVMSAINTLVVFRVTRRIRSVGKIVADFFLSQTAPIAVNLLFIGFSLLMGKSPIVDWLPSFIINFMVFSIHETIYFVYNYQQSRRLYECECKVSAQLKYNVLRSQVNPHFLFNSLNILYSLTHIDVPKSQEFILSLSRMYRYIMSKGDSDKVSLRDELEFLDSYVEVLRMLYYDCLDVVITGRANHPDRQLFPYSLQLLVENIIKHNVISRENPMTVKIDITGDSLTVTNNVCPKHDTMKSDDNTGIGLRYLRQLYAMSGKECAVSETADRFSVTIPLMDSQS